MLWYDRGLESGKSWIGEVKQKISSYYCKGVIFYISRNYLNSPSCLMELDHFFSLISKSALFITIDTELSEDGKELDCALRENGYTEPRPFLTDGGLFLVHEKLSIEDSTEDKLGACERFAEPELLEYTYMYGVGDIAHKITDFFFGRLANVSGVADKNVRRVVIPSYVDNGSKKYRFAGISSSAFMQCDMIEEVVVSDGWISIENHTFVRCPSLRRVILGKPRRLLGSSLGIVHDIFDRCPNASIVFDGKIKYRSAFKGRDDITEAVHTAGESWFGECFSGCQNLTRAVLCRYDNFSERNIPSISVNISSSDKIAAGTDMATGRELDDDVRSYIDTVFAREVTFIPHALPTDEKIRELRHSYNSLTMHFSIVDDFAVAEYVKDISEYEVIIPPVYRSQRR